MEVCASFLSPIHWTAEDHALCFLCLCVGDNDDNESHHLLSTHSVPGIVSKLFAYVESHGTPAGTVPILQSGESRNRKTGVS